MKMFSIYTPVHLGVQKVELNAIPTTVGRGFPVGNEPPCGIAIFHDYLLIFSLKE